MSFLEKACLKAWKRVSEGYYNLEEESSRGSLSLTGALNDDPSLICELKLRSPTKGELRSSCEPIKIAREMMMGGADALSILTDPDHFSGSIKHLSEISKTISLPTLMKDFIVSKVQIEAARRADASAILLIYPIFARGYSRDLTLRDAIDYAHDLGLEVLLEAYVSDDLSKSLLTDADLIGVNSRNLDTLDLSLERAYRMIGEVGETDRIVLESGIRSAHDISLFRRIGVKRFLIGTSIMSSRDIRLKVRELKEGVER